MSNKILRASLSDTTLGGFEFSGYVGPDREKNGTRKRKKIY